ncbi:MULTISPECIES: WxL domain-containing protein [unclassified Enterococcus]|uniref:WxL domain-containing protein n=1 Tax=unclassified Enterococcus TaxID=2608891 RepID=UPI0013ED6FC3|nr:MULTISPECIES: WxL domain-containing protein [unclassified Enterococcus]
MKKQVVATATLSLLALSVSGTSVFAEDSGNQNGTANTNKTNTTTDIILKPGSGGDVEPIVPDDTHDDNSGTGDVGSLSIPYASNITFGQQEIKQGDADYFALNKKPHVQVNDTRGGAKGWSLSVSISPFIGTENKHELKGAQLSLTNGKVTTKNNQSEAPTLAEGTDGTYTLNKDPQMIMLAKEGQGAGAFAAVFEGTDGNNEQVKLHVPRAGVEAQSYTAELTWMLSDAPA